MWIFLEGEITRIFLTISGGGKDILGKSGKKLLVAFLSKKIA